MVETEKTLWICFDLPNYETWEINAEYLVEQAISAELSEQVIDDDMPEYASKEYWLSDPRRLFTFWGQELEEWGNSALRWDYLLNNGHLRLKNSNRGEEYYESLIISDVVYVYPEFREELR